MNKLAMKEKETDSRERRKVEKRGSQDKSKFMLV